MDIEIGAGKAGRWAYGFDDISIVPSRRTRDPEDVDLRWELDAWTFGLPLVASPMDGAVSPATAVEIGRLGGVAVLNLEGIWTRYEDPEPLLAELAAIDDDARAQARLQEVYAAPIDPDLVIARIKELRAAGALAAGRFSPQRIEEFAPTIVRAELDLLVVQGMVVTAEHVASSGQPLNLKRFIREFDIPVVVGDCASYRSALHLMRTGAVGVLVGVGPRHDPTTHDVLGLGVPQATAIADVAGARLRHLDETGVYVHVIADGGLRTSGDLAKAIACGADAVMMGAPLAAAAEAPGKGWHWGNASFHPKLPRGARTATPAAGTLEEILVGPAREGDGRLNLFGGLRAAMAATGHRTLKEFQKADIVVSARSRG